MRPSCLSVDERRLAPKIIPNTERIMVSMKPVERLSGVWETGISKVCP